RRGGLRQNGGIRRRRWGLLRTGRGDTQRHAVVIGLGIGGKVARGSRTKREPGTDGAVRAGDELMTKRTWVLGAMACAVLAGAAWYSKPFWAPEGAVAQAPRPQQGGGRPVPVELATAALKPVPVRVEALGTVTPIATVAIKSRLET